MVLLFVLDQVSNEFCHIKEAESSAAEESVHKT